MPLPDLRARLANGPVLSAWSALVDPVVHEAMVRSSFDAITFDMQHGLHDTASVAAGLSVAAMLGKPAIVRVPIEARATVSRVLDFGASGVILPMIETAADARRLASVAKYPPLGLRSYGPTRAVDAHGYATAADYTRAANAETLAFAMIETRAALDDLETIAAVDGLDGFFVGPSDLSIALSADGTRDVNSSECEAAIRRVLTVARTAKKFTGIYAVGVADARAYRDLGFDLVAVSSDVNLLKLAAADLVAQIKS